MTDEIIWLQYKGWGYQKIVNSLGVSQDVVRGCCRVNGLTGLGTDLGCC